MNKRVNKRRSQRIGSCVAVLLLAARADAPADVESSALEPFKDRIEVAVTRGVAALAARQAEDGSFIRDGWGKSTAIVGLAGMAFLSAGHTPSHPTYGENIDRCVDFIIARQQPDGLLYDGAGNVIGHAPMYAHGIATLFLAEVSGMVDAERQKRVDQALAKAIRLILDAQNVPKSRHNQGGWRYSPTSKDSDLSVSGWNLMALRSARLNGSPVPRESIDKAVAYVRRMYRPNAGFGYTGPGTSTCMSAVGALCLEMCGFHGDPATKVAGQRILNATSPTGGIAWEGGAAVPGRVDYTVYYCTNAMFQIGGQFWEKFAPRIYTGILGSQGRDGSWGGIFGTSIKLICLTLTYRQMPIHQR